MCPSRRRWAKKRPIRRSERAARPIRRSSSHRLKCAANLTVAPSGEEREAAAAYTTSLAYVAQIDGGDAFLTPDDLASAAAFVERYDRSVYSPPVREGLRLYLRYRVATGRASPAERASYEKRLAASRGGDR